MLRGGRAPFDDAPDDLEIDAGLLVDEDVAECRDAPRNSGWCRRGVERQISDRLADDLQVSIDCILHHRVRKERAPAVDRVGTSICGDRMADVLEEDRGVLHNGSASAKMRSRRLRLRLLSVTTSTLSPSSSRSSSEPTRSQGVHARPEVHQQVEVAPRVRISTPLRAERTEAAQPVEARETSNLPDALRHRVQCHTQRLSGHIERDSPIGRPREQLPQRSPPGFS